MTHRITDRSALLLRVAEEDDIEVVRALDHAAFPANDTALQRADPGELEWGVQSRDIYLLESDGAAVAYIYADRSNPRHVYISGLAVLPHLQGRGLGGYLMDHLLTLVPTAETIPVVTVTSPRNIRMLRTLFRRGFVARWVLRDYFGPKKDRFGCQLLGSGTEPLTTGHHTVPVTALPAVYALVEDAGLIIRSIVATTEGPAFVLSRALPGELPGTTPP